LDVRIEPAELFGRISAFPAHGHALPITVTTTIESSPTLRSRSGIPLPLQVPGGGAYAMCVNIRVFSDEAAIQESLRAKPYPRWRLKLSTRKQEIATNEQNSCALSVALLSLLYTS
jgi:hypothetical protein